MRTLIFATKEDANFIRKGFGGAVYGGNSIPTTKDLLNYLNTHENGIAILTGDALLMGWSIDYPALVLFSKNYPDNSKVREQALGRVRYSPEKETA